MGKSASQLLEVLVLLSILYYNFNELSMFSNSYNYYTSVLQMEQVKVLHNLYGTTRPLIFGLREGIGEKVCIIMIVHCALEGVCRGIKVEPLT